MCGNGLLEFLSCHYPFLTLDNVIFLWRLICVSLNYYNFDGNGSSEELSYCRKVGVEVSVDSFCRGIRVLRNSRSVPSNRVFPYEKEEPYYLTRNNEGFLSFLLDLGIYTDILLNTPSSTRYMVPQRPKRSKVNVLRLLLRTLTFPLSVSSWLIFY